MGYSQPKAQNFLRFYVASVSPGATGNYGGPLELKRNITQHVQHENPGSEPGNFNFLLLLSGI